MIVVPVDWTRDVAYGPGQVLDLYLPMVGPRRGAVLWFHGGGNGAAKGATTGELADFVAGDGFVCADVEYRSDADATKAIAWMRAQAQRLGFPANRIAVGGMSRGAGVAVRSSRAANAFAVISLFGVPAEVRIPTFVATGADDPSCPPDRVRRAHAAETWIVEGYGHTFRLETRVAGRMLFQRISDFLLANAR